MPQLLKTLTALSLASLLTFGTCTRVDELRQDPELTPLQQGFKAAAAIGYCVSLAATAFEGHPLPANVTFEAGANSEYSSSGLIYLTVDKSHPLPFNNKIGNILIGGIWDNTDGGGVISILFGDLDILSAEFKLYGIHTIPVIRKKDSDQLVAVFAEQDIVIGEGSDTIIHVGLSRIAFDTELQRLESDQPADVFATVKQNVWFINVDQRNSFSDIYDDEYVINGGGQILEANSTSGGILYHAMIETAFSYATCSRNPLRGTAFIQNIKAGNSIDLGNILLDFHSSCDGQADVQFSTGQYLSSNGQNIHLNFD
ncbi:hypothetical protein C900_05579 [Fulvivirga imtechensis AK7]|uniref:Uncharacterized protein n=1 Tax=Fulvivirga imtechensis AK7 TaxID=1237149 RepID=L8JJE1_9BACT|nr:hypothetical protein [Fulvivirga imtechensis]ELR69021.1 hypothetical protein C900_05579 [Fulvivirga imtechensis AK7]